MEYEIKRFNIWSVAKIVFIIFLIIGFLISLFYVVIIGILQNFVQSFGIDEFEGEAMRFTGFIGIFLIIFLTFFYAIVTTIFSIFFTGLYNIIAGVIGGIKFNINKESFEISEGTAQLEKT
ncbi:MAG: hypothetical protein HWN67_20190 [Candidatus Helarchaeota archaeon]|nr:hypothetical protein [Candidatus Helarchaeota archaeon]